MKYFLPVLFKGLYVTIKVGVCPDALALFRSQRLTAFCPCASCPVRCPNSLV